MSLVVIVSRLMIALISGSERRIVEGSSTESDDGELV